MESKAASRPAGLLNYYDRFSRTAGNVASVLGCFMFACLLLLGAGDVIGRYVFDRPIVGAYEISQILMAGVVLLGWAFTQRKGGHVRADLLISRYPARVRRVIDIIVLCLSLALFILIAWKSLELAVSYVQEDRHFQMIDIPSAPFYFMVPMGAVLISLEFINEIVHFLVSFKKGAPDVTVSH